MWTCTKCGAFNDDEAERCFQCSTPREQPAEAIPPQPTEAADFASAPPQPPPAPGYASVPPPPPLAAGAQFIPPPNTGNIPPANPGELATIGRALSVGWQIFSKNMGLGIVAVLIIYAMQIPFTLIDYGVTFATIAAHPNNPSPASMQPGSMIYMWFILPAIIGGEYYFYLRMVQEGTPQLGDLFNGFRQYGKWMGICYLYALALVGAMLPGGVLIGGGVFLAAQNISIPAGVLLIVAGAIACMVFSWMLYTRWAVNFFTGADGAGISEAFTRSSRLTEGRRWQVFGTMLVLGLVSSAGVLACCVGILFTIPLAMCAMVVYYHDLKTLHGLP